MFWYKVLYTIHINSLQYSDSSFGFRTFAPTKSILFTRCIGLPAGHFQKSHGSGSNFVLPSFYDGGGRIARTGSRSALVFIIVAFSVFSMTKSFRSGDERFNGNIIYYRTVTCYVRITSLCVHTTYYIQANPKSSVEFRERTCIIQRS